MRRTRLRTKKQNKSSRTIKMPVLALSQRRERGFLKLLHCRREAKREEERVEGEEEKVLTGDQSYCLFCPLLDMELNLHNSYCASIRRWSVFVTRDQHVTKRNHEKTKVF